MDTSKLEDTVNTILQDAIAKASEGAEFLKEQIPDVVQQLLHWNLARDLFWFSIGLAVTAAYVAIAVKCYQRMRESEFDEMTVMPCIFILAGGAFLELPALIEGVFNHGLDALQIVIAPKVWLLEYAAHLVKH